MKSLYFVILISLISFNLKASESRKPTSLNPSECAIVNNKTTNAVIINSTKTTISGNLTPITKRILGCEQIDPNISYNFEFYKIKIIAEPQENSGTTLCSIEERVYSKKKNSNILTYQLSSEVERNIPCDTLKTYSDANSFIYHTVSNKKHFITVDSDKSDPYVVYYELVNDILKNKQLKYKGSIKRTEL